MNTSMTPSSLTDRDYAIKSAIHLLKASEPILRHAPHLFVLALLLSGSSGLFAQSGTFTESSVFIGPNACDNTNYILSMQIELDDYIDGVSFILRKVPSERGLQVCPFRPVMGQTILHSSKHPESFKINELDLNIEMSRERLTPFLGCAQKVVDEGLLCLYAKINGSREINLVAQTNYRIDPRVKSFSHDETK